MPLPTFTTPTNNTPTTDAEPLVTTALEEIFSILSGNIESANIAGSAVDTSELANEAVTNGKIANATIRAAKLFSPLSLNLTQLQDGASGQIIVCNSSGVPTYRTLSGDVSITTGGAATISTDVIFKTQSANSGAVGLIPGLSENNLAEGTWLIFGRIDIDAAGAGGASGVRTFQLEKNAATPIVSGSAYANNSGKTVDTATMFCSFTSDGTDDLRMTLTTTPIVNGTSTNGVIVGARLG